ncbi:hypothetical protein EDB81DRAFT_120950 [Dactylonectria macrodidyma]|uniref:Uncharacterized protein n=1 Tax=Dactylonectria macrodidyma TaxID=307937 RepID=A0A9P9E979_9HYPO|nr:hypothetical protein EDB81DRAFT_120950 [Dactylonectria macrodidyma]
MAGNQALPAAGPQFSLQTNATASLAGYAAQGAWWQPQDQSPSLPESGTQSLNLLESGTQSLNLPESGTHSLSLPESGTQSLSLPESSTQSSPPTNFRLVSTDGLLGPSGASSDHDHRDPPHATAVTMSCSWRRSAATPPSH